MVIPNAICMHEEDVGIGWKHTDFRTEEVEVRRLRRLVISTIATVGNYEYGYFWYLYTDGTIEYEVKLSGVVSTGAIADGERPAHGTLIAPACTRRTTSTSSACGSTWRSTATRTPSCRWTRCPSPPGPENPYRHGLGQPAHGLRDARARRRPRSTRCTAATGGSRTPARCPSWATRWPTS